ncbi:MAG: S8 family serine peptidase [Bacteroidales bacterium]|jgi:subtilisin family serine protease|nr:S8 family serine peptidase [Bacteroidales bacterium]
MQIAIVDTGIASIYKTSLRVISGVYIKRQHDSSYIFDSDFSDYHGHGTAVAYLISILSPDSSLVAVRIAQQNDSEFIVHVPEKTLALGIDWCIEKGIRLINVSYSIEEISENGILASVCQKAQKNNIIIVAAYRNNSNISVYPAAFPNVIGVSVLKNSDHGQISIVSEQNYDVAVFGGPYLVNSLNHKITIVKGSSFATAQVTGMVGRMLAIKPTLSFQQVFNYLKKYSI